MKQKPFMFDSSKWILIAKITLFTLVILIGFVYFQHATRGKPTFFAVDRVHETLLPMTALQRPYISTTALLSWAAAALTASYSFDFLHINEQLENLKPYYTKTGYQSLVNSLKKSGQLQRIVNDRILSFAIATEPPILLSEGQYKGSYAWRVQMPMLVAYQGATESGKKQRRIVVTLLINQVSTEQASKGIGISQLIEQTRSSI